MMKLLPFTMGLGFVHMHIYMWLIVKLRFLFSGVFDKVVDGSSFNNFIRVKED
jgi:hypothetical protein